MTALSFTLSTLFLHLPNTLRTASNKDLKLFSRIYDCEISCVKGVWERQNLVRCRPNSETGANANWKGQRSFSFLCAHQFVLADSWQIWSTMYQMLPFFYLQQHLAASKNRNMGSLTPDFSLKLLASTVLTFLAAASAVSSQLFLPRSIFRFVIL